LRLEMGDWKFDAATRDLDAASLVLGERDQIATSASTLGLTPPSALKAAFEGDAGLDKAKAEADAELALLAAIKAARDRLAASAQADPTPGGPPAENGEPSSGEGSQP